LVYFRLWALTAGLWLLGAGYFAFHAFNKPAPFSGNYQYVFQTKDMPWNIDWSKPLYDIIIPPGKGRFAKEFVTVEDKYIQQWDVDVKAGKMVRFSFPDTSILYLETGLTSEDEEYLRNLFWQQRGYRYSLKVTPWLAVTLGPPLALLLLGFGILWVVRGFVKTRGA
jgi:hypothetical protein